MKRLILAGIAAGSIGLLPNPQPADAAKKLMKCMLDAIESCDGAFGNDSPELIAVRGYCYMIRTGMCKFGW
ncbi:MAG: hypothetical protein KAI25_10890 [Hyphomicrobiaceae bacterium]|nr:hypothetical protein [Hyphomicrobiaceae bacterium]